MGGCYSTEKHDGPEYSSIFGPRAAKGEVQKSQVENIPPLVVSWEDLYKHKQVLTFLDLYNSEDSKQRNRRVTNYYGGQYTELHEKSFGFELVGTPVLGSDKGEIEFVFRLDPSAAGSPGLNNIHGNGKHITDSQTEFPVVNSDFEVRRPDIPALKTAIGFPAKGAGNTPLGMNLGSKHQFAHIPANIVAEAEEYQKNAEIQASSPGPSNNLENIAIDAYLENFTVSKFRENLQASDFRSYWLYFMNTKLFHKMSGVFRYDLSQARYKEVVSYSSDPARYTIASPSLPGIQFRDPLTVSASLRFSDGSSAAPKFPAKLYPGLVSPPFLTAAVAIVANKQSLAAMFTSYSDWVGKQNKFPLFIGGEWTSYPTDNRIGISEDTKLPVLSLTGKGEYWTYFLESAYLRSLSDPLSLELKVQSLSHALKDIVGCPIQEVAFKAAGLTQEKLELLLSEIQTSIF